MLDHEGAKGMKAPSTKGTKEDGIAACGLDGEVDRMAAERGNCRGLRMYATIAVEQRSSVPLERPTQRNKGVKMAVQNVTIRLSDTLYHQVKQRAGRMQRSVEEEVVAVVEDALPVLGALPAEIADEMGQMVFLTDRELWQATLTTMTSAENQRMQALLLKQQREGLAFEEEIEAERLAQRQERVMLVRAQAAALLKERGQDVSTLLQPQ